MLPSCVSGLPPFLFLSVFLSHPLSLPSFTTSECQLQFNGVWYATLNCLDISGKVLKSIYWWCWTAIPSILKDIKSLSRLILPYRFPYRIWPLIRTPFLAASIRTYNCIFSSRGNQWHFYHSSLGLPWRLTLSDLIAHFIPDLHYSIIVL